MRASSQSEAASADDEPSTPKPTGAPAARRSKIGRDARPENQVRARAVRHTDAGDAKPADLGRVGHHAMRDPRAVGAPPDPLEILDGPASEVSQGVLVVFGVLGEVGVQADVETRGKLGRVAQQFRVTLNGEHGASAIRMAHPASCRGGGRPARRTPRGSRRVPARRRRAGGHRPSARGSSSRASGGSERRCRGRPRSRRRAGRRPARVEIEVVGTTSCIRTARARPDPPTPRRRRPPRRAAATRDTASVSHPNTAPPSSGGRRG